MSVKRKKRQARQGEVRRLKVTGNGNLPHDSARETLVVPLGFLCSKLDDQHEVNSFLPELSEDLHFPVAPAVSRMSSTEREVANVLGSHAFIGINGGTDTLGKLCM